MLRLYTHFLVENNRIHPRIEPTLKFKVNNLKVKKLRVKNLKIDNLKTGQEFKGREQS